MLKGIAVVLASVTLLASSCSSSEEPKNAFSCESAKSKCPKEGAAPKEVCDAIQDPNCNTVYLAFAICFAENQICKSDGTSDFDATAAKCKSQYDAAEKCANEHPPDGGSRG